jgi:hypothetical protein
VNHGERIDTERLRVVSVDGVVERMPAQIHELLAAARLPAGEPLGLRRVPTDLIVLAHAVVIAHSASSAHCDILLEARGASSIPYPRVFPARAPYAMGRRPNPQSHPLHSRGAARGPC